MSRPAHVFSADDIALLKQCAAGTITTTECARRIGTSRDSCLYRMKRDGLGMPPGSKKALEALANKRPDPPERLRKSDGWVPIAHKARVEWVPLDGAPLTIGEANALREAGMAFTAQQRVDGGFDYCVRLKR